jgi:outer membrane protein TolC
MMPLYNPEAKAEQEAVSHQIKMSESMALRMTEGIEMEVVQSYYRLLLSQNAVTVLNGTYAAAQSNYNVVENYYNQGLMLKSDLLEMQVMVNQSELALQSAQMNVENAQSQFRHVLGVVTQTDYLPIDALSAASTLDISEGELSAHRADFESMQHGINAMHSMVTAADKSFLPKVKAFAGFELNDGIPFAMRANNFQVGVTVGWDIYKGNMRQTTINKTKAEIAEKQLELEENKAQAELEILITRRAIDHIKSQIALHDLAISQTEEALKIRKNRFEQGLEKSNDIIMAETQLTQKRLERLQALYDLNVKHAYLKYLLK